MINWVNERSQQHCSLWWGESNSTGHTIFEDENIEEMHNYTV